MGTLPSNPSDKQKEALPNAHRSFWNSFAERPRDLPAVPSWGERLVPLLFAAMEACWLGAILIGLASGNFFHLRETLVPLWTPFVLIIGSFWIITHLERHNVTVDKENEISSLSSTPLVYVLLAIVILFIIWSNIYIASAWFFDPRWILSLFNDILLLSAAAYRVIGILIISIYFAWRGVRLASFEIEPGRISRSLFLGIGIFLAAIVVQAGNGVSGALSFMLLLLIPVFLACALLSHALSHAISVRQNYTSGLQENVTMQERTLFILLAPLSALLLLIALTIGIFASQSFLVEVQHTLAPLARAYDWLASMIAYGFVFLVTPLFLLISSWHLKTQYGTIHRSFPPSSNIHTKHPPESVVAIAAILKIVLPILLVALVVFLLVFALRRRRIILAHRNKSLYESVWIWELFWPQLKAFLRALWQRFFPQREVQHIQEHVHEMSNEPTARTVREIYRALLTWAASHGFARTKDETPYEFRRRLGEQLPLIEPQLGMVTDSYTAIRYGQLIPDELEVAQVQKNWHDMRNKIHLPPTRDNIA